MPPADACLGSARAPYRVQRFSLKTHVARVACHDLRPLALFLFKLTLHQRYPSVRLSLALPTQGGYRCDLCGDIHPHDLTHLSRHLQTLIRLNIPLLPVAVYQQHAWCYRHGAFADHVSAPLPLNAGALTHTPTLAWLSHRGDTAHILMTVRQS